MNPASKVQQGSAFSRFGSGDKQYAFGGIISAQLAVSV
jgi:hypothetical protein